MNMDYKSLVEPQNSVQQEAKRRNDLENQDFQSKLALNCIQIYWIIRKTINIASADNDRAYCFVKIK